MQNHVKHLREIAFAGRWHSLQQQLDRHCMNWQKLPTAAATKLLSSQSHISVDNMCTFLYMTTPLIVP